MRSTRRMSGSLLTLVTLAITLAGVRASAQTVSVWMTSDNQRTTMQAQPAVTFTAGSTASNPMFVDDARTYQTIEGFGASFTDSAAYLLNQVAPPAVQTSVMSDLFTRNGIGIGVSFIRNPMGASDLARAHYSYDDLPSGQTDPTLANFSIAHDEVDIIPLVRLVRQLNPDVTIMATPWSPPGWMKSTGSMIGGTLLPSMYGPFAQYFVRYIQAYEANGIPIDYISLQNEPLYVPADFPGMSMDAGTQANPDGSKALVAYNETRTSKTFQVVWGARSFNYTLPGLAGATFTWSGTTSGTYVVPATSSIQGPASRASRDCRRRGRRLRRPRRLRRVQGSRIDRESELVPFSLTAPGMATARRPSGRNAPPRRSPVEMPGVLTGCACWRAS
jgi:O-glycosyl hydrolase